MKKQLLFVFAILSISWSYAQTLNVDDKTDCSCNGVADGSISVSASGGNPPYTYEWDNGLSTDSVQNDLSAGTYNVTVTDEDNNTDNQTIIVNQPDDISITFTSTDVVCYGGNDGSIDMSVDGGTPDYSYEWDTGETTEDLSGLFADMHMVTVTDANGCQKMGEQVINEPDDISITFSPTDVLCYGNSDGAIDLTVNGGTASYSYEWGGGETTEDISGLLAGVYMVTVTDANNCQKTGEQVINEPDEILISLLDSSEIYCFGGTTGMIKVGVNGGIPDYSYSWSNGEESDSIAGLYANVYDVTVTDANGCQQTWQRTLSQPNEILISLLDSADIYCYGQTTGMIKIGVDGGVPDYSYLWSNGETTDSIAELPADVYTVTITDVNGCVKTWLRDIMQPDSLSVDLVELNNPTSSGASDGSIMVNGLGGVSPYSYDWSNSSDNDTITNLSADMYTVTVMDANGCISAQTYELVDPPAYVVNGEVTSVMCHGGIDGSINLTIDGGTEPYSYDWSGPNDFASSDSAIVDLSSGWYYVTVIDDNEDTVTNSFELFEPDSLFIDLLQLDNPTSSGASDGILIINSVGGISPYTYSWSNGSENDTLLDLTADTYLVTVTDANGCVFEQAYELIDPSSFTVEGNITHVVCHGGADGGVESIIDGGTSPYSYEWSGPNDFTSSDSIIVDLTIGMYYITVIDDNEDTVTNSFEVLEPDSLFIELLELNNPSSSGASDGSFLIEGVGGVPPYLYSWSNSADGDSITDLSADTYTVTLTDENGCEAISSFVLTDPSDNEAEILDFSFEEQAAPFYSNGIDTIFIDVVSETDRSALVASFVLSSGATVKIDTTVQESGVTVNDFVDPVTYTVTSEDGAIVKDWAIIVKVADDNPIFIEPYVTDVICYGDVTGSIDIEVHGGEPPYTYNWVGENGFTSSDTMLTDIPAGLYSVTVTDNNSLSTEDSFDVMEPSAILINVINKENPTAYEANDGWIRIEAIGGVGDYTYEWSNGIQNTTIYDLEEGTYTIQVADSNFCQARLAITLIAPALNTETEIMTYGFEEQYGQAFFDKPNQTINVEVVHGTDLTSLVASFLLSEGATVKIDTTLQESGVTANDFSSNLTYTITAEDPAYIQNWNVIVSEREDTSFAVSGVLKNVSCNSYNDGSINLSINGGTSPYTYQWVGPDDFSSTEENIFELKPGAYSVTVTDANSSQTSSSFNIIEPSVLVAMIPQVASCTGACNGQATVIVSGGTPIYSENTSNYSYLWNNAENSKTATITDLCIDSTYTVTVTDLNACEVVKSITISESPSEIQITTDAILNASCPGADNGSIDISVTGGAGSYTYLWSNGATTQDVDNLTVEENEGSTEYTLTVTDANTCKAYYTGIITQASLPEFEVQTSSSTCGNANGSANVSGITGVHNTVWSNGTVGDVVENLSPGTYSVLVEFESGCSATKYFQITDGNMTVTENIVNPTCLACNDGEINLSISGGSAPYVVEWSNGVEGTNNVNLFTGSYSAIITDANGCVDNICIHLDVKQKLSAFMNGANASACELSDGYVEVLVSGGVTPYTYSWSDNTGGQTSMLANNLPAGIYTCTISDASGETLVKSIAIGDNEGADIEIINKEPSVCGRNTGLISVEVFGGSGNYSYLWSNGARTQDILDLPVGDYHLIVTDNMCKSAFNTRISPKRPLVQQICMVTVDTATNHNLVVWEKEQEFGVDYFNVYKQNCSGEYNKIGTVAADAVTVFEDVTSHPGLQSDSYRISAVNDCGTESVLSSKHKTMHLELVMNQSEESGQLIWDDYEGFPNPIFKLYVKTESFDSWAFLREVPNTQYYVNVGFTGDTLAYSITVEKPEGEYCDAWNGNHASGGPYYQSSSNIEDEGMVATRLNQDNVNEFSMYPNPSNGVLNIENTNLIHSIRIYDVSGKLVNSYQDINKNQVRLNTQNINKGIYLIEIQSTELIKRRIVIE